MCGLQLVGGNRTCGLICLCGEAVILLGSKVFSHNLMSCKDLYLYREYFFTLHACLGKSDELLRHSLTLVTFAHILELQYLMQMRLGNCCCIVVHQAMIKYTLSVCINSCLSCTKTL